MKHASMRAEAQCSTNQHVLNFFFHARGGSFETSTDGLFRSLLHQLLEKVPAVYDVLDKRRLGLVERQGWSSALLKDTFREAVLSLDQDRVTCYIDAMDECCHDDIEHIIQYFDNLGDALVVEEKPFYVCLSSRHYPNLKSSKSVELILDIQNGHDEDIQQYIQRRLMIDGKALKQHLAESIRARAHGVFLWVVPVVALVNQDDRNGNTAEVYQRLEQTPTGLSDLFGELIGRGANSGHLRPLLQWVTFSTRPLTPTELYDILMSSAFQDFKLEPPVFDRASLAKFILRASKGLVEITTRSWPRVQFIHESLRTYFLGEGIVHLIDQGVTNRARSDSSNRPGVQESVAMTARCHDLLKERCLAYIEQIIPLVISLPRTTLKKRIKRRERILSAYPSFDYAVFGVMRHANIALDLGLAQQAFIDALPWNELNTLHGLANFDWSGWQELTDTTEPWSKAYIVAKFGCPKLLKAVLEAQPYFEADRWQWGVILCASIETDDYEGVSIALQAGADANELVGASPYLQHAITHAFRQYSPSQPQGWDIVKLLLSHGARTYATFEGTDDNLYDACGSNDLRIVRILLGKHLKADTKCSNYGVSLARAVGQANRRANDEMLQFLLEKGAETGWWSSVGLLNTSAHRGAFFEVTFGDVSILRWILKEGPRILRSSGARSRTVLRGGLEGSTGVTMQFELGPLWVG